ncbi:hypothetical protein MIR68_010657 [Amoeboaphelidium protococcarum]|nr:hypothetical protein MIR68_010657 [Amoeboaphelidium protococcarum]
MMSTPGKGYNSGGPNTDLQSKRMTMPPTVDTAIMDTTNQDQQKDSDRSRAQSAQSDANWLNFLLSNREGQGRMVVGSQNQLDQQVQQASVKHQRQNTAPPTEITQNMRRQVVSMQERPIGKLMKTFDMELRKLDQALDPSVDLQTHRTEDGTLTDSNEHLASIAKDLKMPQNAPGWNVKVYDSDNNDSTDVTQHEYKTFFIHPDSTIYEVLAQILKKWRIIDPMQLDIVSKGTRLIMSQAGKKYIKSQGWQFLLVENDEVEFAYQRKPFQHDMKFSEIMRAAPPFWKPIFTFKKMLSSSSAANNQQAEGGAGAGASEELSYFTPCYAFKLDSNYPDTFLNDSPSVEVDFSYWQKKYVTMSVERKTENVSKQYVLKCFKNETQARWANNKASNTILVLKIVSIEPFNKLSISQNGSPRLGFCVKIATRTKNIYFSLNSETERQRMINEIQLIKRSHAEDQITSRQIHLLKQDARQSSVASNVSYDQAFADLSPLQKLMVRLEETQRVNDIDLPPFDMNSVSEEQLSSELSSWATATNQKMLNNFRDLIQARIKRAVGLNNLTDVALSLGPVYDSVRVLDRGHENFQSNSNDGESGNNVVSAFKKLFKLNEAGKEKEKISPNMSISSNMQGIGSGNIGSTPISGSLFGTNLEDLSERYDTSCLGIPAVPHVIIRSIDYILEKGLHVNGIFRIAGSVKRMDALKKAFERVDLVYSQKAANPHFQVSQNATANVSQKSTINDLEVDFSQYNVHDVAGVLKWFLRDLPEPLLHSKMYRAFLQLDKIKDFKIKVELLGYFVMILPPTHRHLLEKLLSFLHEVSLHSEDQTVEHEGQSEPEVIKGNLMTSMNLAVCLGPNILRDVTVSSGGSKGSEMGQPGQGGGYSPQLPASKIQSGKSGVLPPGTEAGDSMSDDQREINDSSAVVNIVKLLIDNYEEIFKIPQDLIVELKTFVQAPNVYRQWSSTQSQAPTEVIAGSSLAYDSMKTSVPGTGAPLALKNPIRQVGQPS